MRTYFDVGKNKQLFVDSGPKWSVVGKPTNLHYDVVNRNDQHSRFINPLPKFYAGVTQFRRRIRRLIQLSHVLYENGMPLKAYKPLKRLSLIGLTMSINSFVKMIDHILGLCLNENLDENKDPRSLRLPSLERRNRLPSLTGREKIVYGKYTIHEWSFRQL